MTLKEGDRVIVIKGNATNSKKLINKTGVVVEFSNKYICVDIDGGDRWALGFPFLSSELELLEDGSVVVE